MRTIKSRLNHGEDHVHHFIDDEDCPCGRTFDQAIGTNTDRFVLEINPEDP